MTAPKNKHKYTLQCGAPRVAQALGRRLDAAGPSLNPLRASGEKRHPLGGAKRTPQTASRTQIWSAF